jgi:hypothetical protein
MGDSRAKDPLGPWLLSAVYFDDDGRNTALNISYQMVSCSISQLHTTVHSTAVSPSDRFSTLSNAARLPPAPATPLAAQDNNKKATQPKDLGIRDLCNETGQRSRHDQIVIQPSILIQIIDTTLR